MLLQVKKGDHRGGVGGGRAGGRMREGGRGEKDSRRMEGVPHIWHLRHRVVRHVVRVCEV